MYDKVMVTELSNIWNRDVMTISYVFENDVDCVCGSLILEWIE